MRDHQTADPGLPKLAKLSIVIPARDEEQCIASTVEHLHLELALHAVPHEIVVVDDGSSDGTWRVLEELKERARAKGPQPGPHGLAWQGGLDR
jgi:dolichol-phosphate mannosyltransferase